MLIGVWSFSLLAQGLPTQSKQVMQRKLDASQQLLAALVTSDWVALDRRSRALKAQTADPGWDQMRLPEFQKHTAAFVQVTDALIEAAGRRDQREALAAYNGLVTSCVECHRHVSRARIVKTKGGQRPPLSRSS
jgi:cytochrome c556